MKKVQRVFTGNHTQKTSLAEQQEIYRSQIRVERQAGIKTENTLDDERAVLVTGRHWWCGARKGHYMTGTYFKKIVRVLCKIN